MFQSGAFSTCFFQRAYTVEYACSLFDCCTWPAFTEGPQRKCVDMLPTQVNIFASPHSNMQLRRWYLTRLWLWGTVLWQNWCSIPSPVLMGTHISLPPEHTVAVAQREWSTKIVFRSCPFTLRVVQVWRDVEHGSAIQVQNKTRVDKLMRKKSTHTSLANLLWEKFHYCDSYCFVSTGDHGGIF